MPKRDDRSRILSGRTQSYSLSVEGTPALLRSDTVIQDELVVGDKIKLFALSDGKTFITKVEPDSMDWKHSDEVYTVGRLTPAHIYFDDEITVKEI